MRKDRNNHLWPQKQAPHKIFMQPQLTVSLYTFFLLLPAGNSQSIR